MLSSIGGEAAAQIDSVERLRHYFNKDIPAELFGFLKPINYGCRFVRGDSIVDISEFEPYIYNFSFCRMREQRSNGKVFRSIVRLPSCLKGAS